MYRVALASAALLVSAAACTGPSAPVAPSISGPTRDSHDRYFPIAAGPHAVDCNSCHGSVDTFKQFDCLGCHAQVPTAQGHAGVAGFAYASPSCLQCHPRGTSDFTHAGFPVAQGDKHALGKQVALGTFTSAIDCQACHTVPADLSQADCTGCHTQASMTTSGGASFHGAVPDLGWPTPPSPHATSLQCLLCHADSTAPVQVAIATSSKKGKHDPSNPAIVFDISAGSAHDTANVARPMACLTCHPAVAHPNAAVPAVAAADFTQQACTACHLQTGTLQQDLNALHAGVTTPAPGFTPVPAAVTPAYSKTCLLCHADGKADPAIAAQNHSAFFPIGATDSHTYSKVVTVKGKQVALSCAACHADANNRSNVDCTACHLEHDNNGAPGSTVPADQATAHANKVGITAANNVAHNLWSGTGPVGDGTGASARCVVCHAGDAQKGGLVAAHGAASAATGHQIFSIDAGNANHFVSCDQCHTATLTAAGRKNPQADFGVASCDACHAAGGSASIAAAHASFAQPLTQPYNAGDSNNAVACLTCHPNGGQAANFNHAWFPIAGADKHNSAVARCADCHSTQASYSGDPAANLPLITCTKCHDDSAANTKNQNGVTTKQAHQAARVGKDIWDVPGGLDYTNNALCLKCHAGNIIDPNIAAVSTPLVFRLAQHDTHCRMSDKSLLSGDQTHNVDHNADAANLPRCFACHDALATGTSTPWATDWKIAGPNAPTQSCKNCHEHQNNPPSAVTCR